MQGKRFGAGILAGLVLGILVVASPGLSAFGALGLPSSTYAVDQTSTTTSVTSGSQPGNVLAGSENSSTSTVTSQGTGNTDQKATGSPRALSSLSNIASQPALLDGLVLAPLFLAFVLGGILYSLSARRADKDTSE